MSRARIGARAAHPRTATPQAPVAEVETLPATPAPAASPGRRLPQIPARRALRSESGPAPITAPAGDAAPLPPPRILTASQAAVEALEALRRPPPPAQRALTKLDFGVVLFDDKMPGPGWACQEGGAPFRISEPAELSSHVLWLTNADYDAFAEAGLNKNPWFRHGGYLRGQIGQLLEEWGMTLSPPEQQAVAVAGFFGRIMTLAAQMKGQEPSALFAGSSLAQDLGVFHRVPEMPAPDQSLAARHAVQEWNQTQVRSPKHSVMVTLRRPRLAHALDMLRTELPAGPWEYIPAGSIGEDVMARADWLVGCGRPVLAAVKTRASKGDHGTLIAFGQGARDDRGGSLKRSWVCGPELAWLNEHFQLEVFGAWLGDAFEPGLMADLIEDDNPHVLSVLNAPLGEMSWSLGMMAENLWLSATRAPRIRGAKFDRDADRQVPFRAAWLRAQDRIRLFQDARKLRDLGYAVKGYGIGSISVALQPTRMTDLVRDAFSIGLQVPFSVTLTAETGRRGRTNWQAKKQADSGHGPGAESLWSRVGDSHTGADAPRTFNDRLRDVAQADGRGGAAKLLAHLAPGAGDQEAAEATQQPKPVELPVSAWGGDPRAALTSMFRAAGRRDILQRADALGLATPKDLEELLAGM